jgi:hypothetical protein
MALQEHVRDFGPTARAQDRSASSPSSSRSCLTSRANAASDLAGPASAQAVRADRLRVFGMTTRTAVGPQAPPAGGSDPPDANSVQIGRVNGHRDVALALVW